MKYHFIPQDDDRLDCTIRASSFDDAVDKLIAKMYVKGNWKVRKHLNGELAVDLFLNNVFVDTLLVSEYPDKGA